MSTITKYKLSCSKEDSTDWMISWHDSEQAAKKHSEALSKTTPGLKVIIKPWDFEVHEKLDFVQTVPIPLPRNQGNWNFTIHKNSKGIYFVSVEYHQGFNQTFESKEEAMEAIRKFAASANELVYMI
jgi:hypothetical protein